MKNTENSTGKGTALVVTTLCSFITPFMGSSINIALPAIGKEFGLSAVYLNWIATAFLLTTAAFLLPAGKLADIKGRVKILKTGIFVFTVFSIMCGVSFSGEFLIIARSLQGIGSAMLYSTAMAIIVSIFPMEKRGAAIGINIAAVYVGLSAGPFIGGIITQAFGWRFIFYITAALGVMLLILLYTKFKFEWVEAGGEKFDVKGAVLYAVVLCAVMTGFSLFPASYGFYLAGAGAVGFVLFIKLERIIPNPVLNVELFASNRAYAFSNLAALINYSATFAIGYLLSFYLQFVKGLSPRQAGTLLIAQPVVQALFSPLAGRISDRIEPALVSSIGMAITTAGLGFLFFLSETTGFVYVIICLCLLGFGFALFSSPNANAIMSSVEKKHYGVAASTQSTMRLTGQMFSMGIVMIIFAFLIGHTVISQSNIPELLQSIRVSFAVFCVLCFAGIFASLLRGKIRENS